MPLPDKILVVYLKAGFFIFLEPSEYEKIDRAIDQLLESGKDSKLEARACVAGMEYVFRAKQIDFYYLTTEAQRKELADQDKDWNAIFRRKKEWESGEEED